MEIMISLFIVVPVLLVIGYRHHVQLISIENKVQILINKVENSTLVAKIESKV